MKTFATTAAALMLAAGLMGVAQAQPAAADDHHPAQTETGKSSAAAPNAAIMKNADAQLQQMHAMHEKMAAAQTPQERQALMAEHMKTMQDGMRMMESMHGTMASGNPPGGMAGMPHDPRMMEKRMDMMESMMQMMMDRLSMPQPSTPGTK